LIVLNKGNGLDVKWRAISFSTCAEAEVMMSSSIIFEKE
jgi:hypothetical protein